MAVGSTATDVNPVDDDVPIEGVVTRSGSVFDPEASCSKSGLPLSLEKVARAQANDAFCKSQREVLDTVVETRFFIGKNGLLLRRAAVQGTEQLVVPT